MAQKVCGINFGLSGSGSLTRLQAATLMIAAQGRSTHPITGSYTLPVFWDVPSTDPNYWIVTEVSTEHDWYTDAGNQEYWG